MVGAPYTNTTAGRTYIYDRNAEGPDNWGLRTEIIPEAGSAYDDFGISVSIDGDTLAVGANGKDLTQSCQGKVYIWKGTSYAYRAYAF